MLLAGRRFAVAILSFLAASVVVLHPSIADEPGRFIRTGLSTLTPAGWADFCYRYRAECRDGAALPEDVEASNVNLALIDKINRRVNGQIEPVSDVEHWGQVDRWDIPSDGRGDCEDYVLLKRKLLIEAGLPRQALLVTIVRDEANEGHAILTVKTTRGDFILDNMSDQVKIWSRTPYRFIKRQSQEDQNVWVTLGAPAQTARVMYVPLSEASGRTAR